MVQTGYGFVIAAAPAMDGRILMVASQSVRNIEINHRHDIFSPSGPSPWQSFRSAQEDTTISASLSYRRDQYRDHLVHLNVEQGGYAEAWRRLFDIWVPPQFTDETRSQILTHYIFGQ